MTAQVLFNQLTYMDRLIRGGFSPDQARASAEALETAFGESVATKIDLAEVKAEIKTEIAAVRTDLKTEIATARTEIQRTKVENIIWVCGFNLASIGAIFAIAKLLH